MQSIIALVRRKPRGQQRCGEGATQKEEDPKDSTAATSQLASCVATILTLLNTLRRKRLEGVETVLPHARSTTFLQFVSIFVEPVPRASAPLDAEKVLC